MATLGKARLVLHHNYQLADSHKFQRMNPELVFWHEQTPSPTTPTYEEAVNDVQAAVGYQPPLYISPKRERGALEGERVSNVHPLERERLVGLMGNTMSFQR